MQLKNTFQMSFLYSEGLEMRKSSGGPHSFYEFFAGSGMVREGLGPSWNCVVANDFDEKKAAAYRENWGGGELLVGDVGKLTSKELPGQANLAWASFPCQDLSLAGAGAGLRGKRSGTFWPFWNLIHQLRQEKRQPDIVVLENVCGALTSHGGSDFRSLIEALGNEGYRTGALVINAAMFVPQSRPRLFIVGVSDDVEISSELVSDRPLAPFHTKGVVAAHAALSRAQRANWIWWNLPIPPPRISTFSDLIESNAPWHTTEQTEALLALMSPLHRAKVAAAKKRGRMIAGTIYKRTRLDESGGRVQRAEVRFDQIAGCLRTPGGGSSRQTIIAVHGNKVRSRLLSPREAARLMGLPEKYILPRNYNDAYHLMGDGVAVPVVSHLSRYLLEPLVRNAESRIEHAA